MCSSPREREFRSPFSARRLADTPSTENGSNMYASPISSITPDDLAFLTDGALSDEVGDWEADATSCGVCAKTFSAMLRRHHCRICGKCVCASCSPSSVMLPGARRVERACTPCVWNAQRGPAVKKRLMQLSTRIFELGGGKPPPVEPKDLDQAAVLCETALMQHEEVHTSMKIQADRADAEMVMEQQARQELASQVFFRERLHLPAGREASRHSWRSCTLHGTRWTG